jgi:protein-disulfide isomerase
MRTLITRIVFWTSGLLVIAAGAFTVIMLTITTAGGVILPGVISDTDHVKGNKDSSVILVEYSDFQCPACVQYYYLTEDILSEFENHIQYVYRYFPLRTIHANAQISAQAAEAAGKQGKFWEMYSMIFENQKEWESKTVNEATNIFIEYAQTLGLDAKRFVEDLESKEVIGKVNADYDSAMEAELYYTPTFFLNGVQIKNPRSLEDFRLLIKEAIEKNNT